MQIESEVDRAVINRRNHSQPLPNLVCLATFVAGVMAFFVQQAAAAEVTIEKLTVKPS